eukprot:2697404-Pleurochrysis_carterae.AAC.2
MSLSRAKRRGTVDAIRNSLFLMFACASAWLGAIRDQPFESRLPWHQGGILWRYLMCLIFSPATSDV